MRLYLYADSKNKIGYTPDFLILHNPENGQTKEYDIQGTTDYDNEKLSCRTKGDLYVYNDEEDDYTELNEKEQEELINLLKNENIKFSVAIYPTNDANKKLVEEDELSVGSGSIFIKLLGKEIQRDFNFSTEFYGF